MLDHSAAKLLQRDLARWQLTVSVLGPRDADLTLPIGVVDGEIAGQVPGAQLGRCGGVVVFCCLRPFLVLVAAMEEANAKLAARSLVRDRNQ